ncbi:MAG TPA: RidA family protein [Thermomicrobiales bacterium]|nr:RidA family protein [Thermomicrobiales bacterium]
MTKREILKSDKLPAPANPYSVATMWGGLLFTSGQVADDTSLDVAGQTEQVMEKLKLIMKEAGTGFEHALKSTCFLADINDFQAFNAVYRRYVGEDKPARSTIEAKLAGPAMKVEIEMIVGIPSGD